jgi:hypothetical protein
MTGLPPDVNTNATAVEFLSAMADRQEPQSGLIMGVIMPTTVGYHPAAWLDLAVPNQGEGRVLAIDYQDGIMALIFVATAPGELAQWQPTALAIAESITYSGETGIPDNSSP